MKTGINKFFSSNIGLIAGLFAIAVALTGCGNDSGSGSPRPGGAPGAPGYASGVTGPIGGGAYRVSFVGTDVYSSQLKLVGGPVAQNGGANCSMARCYCGMFGGPGAGYNTGYYTGYQGGYVNYGMVTSCWLFKNFDSSGYNTVGQYIPYNDTGTVNIGGSGAAASGTYFEGTSSVEPGVSVRMIQTGVTRPDGSHINVVGEVILSAAFMQRNFGTNVAPNFIGAAFDFSPQLNVTSGRIPVTGGILLYTGGNAQTNFTGVFLSI